MWHLRVYLNYFKYLSHIQMGAVLSCYRILRNMLASVLIFRYDTSYILLWNIVHIFKYINYYVLRSIYLFKMKLYRKRKQLKHEPQPWIHIIIKNLPIEYLSILFAHFAYFASLIKIRTIVCSLFHIPNRQSLTGLQTLIPCQCLRRSLSNCVNNHHWHFPTAYKYLNLIWRNEVYSFAPYLPFHSTTHYTFTACGCWVYAIVQHNM